MSISGAPRRSGNTDKMAGTSFFISKNGVIWRAPEPKNTYKQVESGRLISNRASESTASAPKLTYKQVEPDHLISNCLNKLYPIDWTLIKLTL